MKKMGSPGIYKEALPVSISIRLFPVVRALVLGGATSREISTTEELTTLLGTWRTKIWNDGSIGTIKVPVLLKSSKKNRLRITFHCRIENKEGILQYPLKYN